MKNTSFLWSVILISGLAWALNAPAAIIGINTPVTSSASITFDDTNSSLPPLGSTWATVATSPWTGATLTLSPTTDPTTLDFAQGDIDASFIPASNIYAININNVTLTQAVVNTGFAVLDFIFNVEYQLDPAGLPLQPTLYPNFVVNGTVQPGGFATIAGQIDYYGVNTAGVITNMESVLYNTTWNTPGPFTGTAFGVPINGTTPTLMPNTTLTLDGHFRFLVDPASISAFSVQSIPEPSTVLLGFLGSLALWSVGRRART